jgi:hypothetical protein
VAADCTGHGVPGRIYEYAWDFIFKAKLPARLKTQRAAQILDHLRDKIKITLGQTDPYRQPKGWIGYCLVFV